jgi:hypothetical protein
VVLNKRGERFQIGCSGDGAGAIDMKGDADVGTNTDHTYEYKVIVHHFSVFIVRVPLFVFLLMSSDFVSAVNGISEDKLST